MLTSMFLMDIEERSLAQGTCRKEKVVSLKRRLVVVNYWR